MRGGGKLHTFFYKILYCYRKYATLQKIRSVVGSVVWCPESIRAPSALYTTNPLKFISPSLIVSNSAVRQGEENYFEILMYRESGYLIFERHLATLVVAQEAC